jgi:uncharacterized protein YbcC (UPF0753/DUF2309 family)
MQTTPASLAADSQASLLSRPVTPFYDESHVEFSGVKDVLGRAVELLPAQGPMSGFVFLNTLQAFENLPFDDGVSRGARLFGCQPYLTEEVYREKFIQGRIRPEDLMTVLREDLAEEADASIGMHTTRFDLRLAMLQYPLRRGPAAELRWFVAETDALLRLHEGATPESRRRFMDETRHWAMRDLQFNLKKGHPTEPVCSSRQMLIDLLERFEEARIDRWSESEWESFALQALWRICHDGVEGIETFAPLPAPLARHRDVLLEATGQDSDALVHEVLIRFCAAFTDQGFAQWPLPHRDEGFYRAFCSLYNQSGGPPDPWLKGLSQELARLQNSGIGPQASIRESLELLGVPEDEWDDFIPASLLALRGWAGLIHQMECREDRVGLPVPQGTLIEFLAVRLILDRWALRYLAFKAMDYEGPLTGVRDQARSRITKVDPTSIEQRAFLVFQLAQVLGWSPPALYRLSKKQWALLFTEIEIFSNLDRRRMLHRAFERRLRMQALDAISIHTERPPRRVESPRFQAVFCIDTREESFRRHLEEIAPDTETFGAAGFFCVAMYYRGIADANFTPLCPIVIRPKHWVIEEPVYSLEAEDRRRARTRRAVGSVSHQVHVRSRSVAGGALLSAGLGVLASVPLVTRVLFPRLTAQFRRTCSLFVQPPPVTRLRLERISATPGPGDDDIGFSLEEMAGIGERTLRDIGLTSGFARLVMFFGHGSSCMNNPHKSAYDCGACSGGAGGPNARALAGMLNDRRVRQILSDRGLEIPNDTIFLGGLHNTANDSIAFYDLDLLPKSHQRDFEAARDTLDQACDRNAHERCRRFNSAPLKLSLEEAKRHVEGRAEDLAQTRPEYGNASNAVCFVGRRARTRGLFLDRRCFMHSYDPTQDDEETTILARILSAVVPVCSGINLQYFFSSVDSTGYGCGTKLPHNVTSLLGVMDGAASDLRTGLPWQGVEIHEPVRLLIVIETSPLAMLQIMKRNPLVGRILRNSWVQLAVIDPGSSEILVYRDQKFHLYKPESEKLPQAPTSIGWYRGCRQHLEFAEIGN